MYISLFLCLCPPPITWLFVKIKRSSIRKGMVMVSPRLCPQATWEFEAEILVLHHPTTISPRYQAMGGWQWCRKVSWSWKRKVHVWVSTAALCYRVNLWVPWRFVASFPNNMFYFWSAAWFKWLDVTQITDNLHSDYVRGKYSAVSGHWQMVLSQTLHKHMCIFEWINVAFAIFFKQFFSHVSLLLYPLTTQSIVAA